MRKVDIGAFSILIHNSMYSDTFIASSPSSYIFAVIKHRYLSAIQSLTVVSAHTFVALTLIEVIIIIIVIVIDDVRLLLALLASSL